MPPPQKSIAVRSLTFLASQSAGKVSAVLILPNDVEFLLVLAHGAGAGMKHRFMEDISAHLADRKIGTFRYQFPYMEQSRRFPDPKAVLTATVRSAIECAAKFGDGAPLLAGGKSMGGRMTSNAAAEQPLIGVRGIVFFGFPLHPPNKVGTERAEHLKRVKVPMLFLQGTKDEFAEMPLLKSVCKDLGKRATLHVFEGADHSFHVPKSSGKTTMDIMQEMVDSTSRWAQRFDK